MPLVPGRSIAVDHALHVYGTPFFIAADLPIANEKAATKFRRLMVAQDTGSAIVGPARADIYFGAGDEAARMAGRIKNPGNFVMLLPRALDPVEAGRDTPLPPERPSAFSSQRHHHGRSDRGGCAAAGTETNRRSGAKAGRRRHRGCGEAKTAAKAKAMSRRRQLSDEEEALWAGFTRSIKPLKSAKPGAKANLKSSAAPPVASPPAPSQLRSHPVAPRQTPPAPSPPLAPLGRRLKQRVARGREPIDARLDLHGMTQQEAHAALLRFLHRAQASGVKTALVVTGKGLRKSSRDAEHDAGNRPGVLKRQVPLWLALPEFRPLVVGFDDAHVGHGGEGALYVRLRRGK